MPGDPPSREPISAFRDGAPGRVSPVSHRTRLAVPGRARPFEPFAVGSAGPIGPIVIGPGHRLGRLPSDADSPGRKKHTQDTKRPGNKVSPPGLRPTESSRSSVEAGRGDLFLDLRVAVVSPLQPGDDGIALAAPFAAGNVHTD